MQPKLSQLLKGRDDEKPFVSFEYFAPKTDEGVKNLHERIERMRAYGEWAQIFDEPRSERA
jgi:5,10-methylenetetrahydrofolate reductase